MNCQVFNLQLTFYSLFYGKAGCQSSGHGNRLYTVITGTGVAKMHLRGTNYREYGQEIVG
jgi:hypothetical protein